MVLTKKILLTYLLSIISFFCLAQNGMLVFQTDFGLKDGAVAAMKGVAMKVSGNLKIFDLTHEIPAFNIWEAAYRLQQTASYWPEGTVFVSVVDPGVGSERKSIVLETKSGHYFVTPDNGTLTLIASSLGVREIRVIDEKINRLPGSSESYTFHGRDVFAYTGARLASKKISFQQIGPVMNEKLVMINYRPPVIASNMISGNIEVLDPQYGNVWTNISDSLVRRLSFRYGDSLHVEIYEKEVQKFSGAMPFVQTFAGVPEQHNLAYLNSLLNFSFAINKGNFAAKYGIGSGPDWKVVVRKNN